MIVKGRGVKAPPSRPRLALARPDHATRTPRPGGSELHRQPSNLELGINCLLRFLSESEGGSVASVGRDLAAWTAVPIFTAPPVEEPGHATSLPRAHRCADRLRPCPRCRMWSTARWDARWQRQPTDRAAAAHPP